MRTYKIHQDYYPDFQQAADAAFEDVLIKTGRCQNVFPPEAEADENGYITLRVKQWLLDLEGMTDLLSELEEVTE
jgi:hypothetical protein